MRIGTIVLLLMVTGANISNYFSIRKILWSIVYLNRNKKVDKESIVNQISMRYLLKYVSKCRKDFIVWLTVKRVYVCAEIIIELIYIFLIVFGSNIYTQFIRYYTIFMLAQILLWMGFLSYHLYYHGGHLTKYDVMRMKKRRKR